MGKSGSIGHKQRNGQCGSQRYHATHTRPGKDYQITLIKMSFLFILSTSPGSDLKE